jgi:integrase
MTQSLTPAVLHNTPPERLRDASALNDEAAQAIAAFYKESQSRNTARTYKTALQYWGAWHALRYGSPLTAPVAPNTVLQFIVDHLEHNPNLAPPEISPYSRQSDTTQHLLPAAIDRHLVDRKYKARLGPWTFSTVETRLAALSRAHERYIIERAHLGVGPDANPLKNPAVRQFLKAVRRVYAKRARAPKRPNAATKEVMDALLATCDDSLAGIRDRAILLFGWASGGRRRSEIIAASYDNVKRDGDSFLYDLKHSKTNQAGRRDAHNLKPIAGSAAQALERWFKCLSAQRIHDGKLFRKIMHDKIMEPLTPDGIRQIIKERARQSAIPLGRISPHSLRSGFVTEAGRRGIPLGETMAMTGHKSVQTAMGYYHAGEVTQSRAARLMDVEGNAPKTDD